MTSPVRPPPPRPWLARLRDAPARAPLRLGRQLRFRVFLLVSLGALLPATLGFGLGWSRLRELDEEILASRRAAAAAVAAHVDEELTVNLATLQRLASSPGLAGAGAAPQEVRELLRRTLVQSPFRALFLLDGAGQTLVEEPRGGRSVAPLAVLPELRRTLEDGRPRVSGLAGVGPEARTYALVAVVDWHGRPVAAVAGLVDVARAGARELGQLVRGGAGHADLVDADGRVLASSDPARLRGQADCGARLRALVAGKQAASGRCRDCHAGGREEVMSFAPLSVASWGVAVQQPEERVLATAGQLPKVALFGALLLSLALAFAWGASRMVTRPVALLTDVAERIAAGATDEAIPELGEDELGRLARSVDRMRGSLRELVEGVARSNELLEERVEERTRELALANEALRDQDEQRRSMLAMVIGAQEEERRRIARELHDETTQSLAVLVMGLETASQALRTGGPQPRLEEVKALAVRTLEEVHRLILDLRPAVLDDLGLFSALRWYADRVLQGRGVSVRFELSEPERRLPSEIESALFRVGQEAMNNIARHAHAESVLVQLGVHPAPGAAGGRELTLEIEDDGQGFDPDRAPADRPHYGLMGIRERVALLGGTVTIESSPGRGTRVAARVPLPDGSPAEPSLKAAAAGLSSRVP